MAHRGGHQPYARNSGRVPTLALIAAMKGRTGYDFNPQDTRRLHTKRRKQLSPFQALLEQARRGIL